MKVNELRIGSIIKYQSKTITVTGIIGNTIYHGGGFDSYIGSYEVFKPIKLTEEWLLKFGFRKDMLLFEIEKASLFAVKKWQVGRSIEWLIFWGDNRLPKIEIQYVHQLQNLYFALTGKELEIK